MVACGAVIGLATSTSRASLGRKLASKPWLHSVFAATACGDEVPEGKPAPDVFAEAARRLGVSPCDCLCFEDAPSGVQGAVAAGMRVVVVPSLPDAHDGLAVLPPNNHGPGVVELLPSLLAWQPVGYGLPPFADVIGGVVIPVTPPIRLRGPVVRGFGRGSRDLGIPTANLDADALLRGSVAEAVTGIYAGWASIGESADVHMMVMSIGWNPQFKNTHKTAEPWILADFDEPFYGKEIRLVACGYVRPEAAFSSLPALVQRIHQDAADTRAALAHPALAELQHDAWLAPGSSAGSSSGAAREVD